MLCPCFCFPGVLEMAFSSAARTNLGNQNQDSVGMIWPSLWKHLLLTMAVDQPQVIALFLLSFLLSLLLSRQPILVPCLR